MNVILEKAIEVGADAIGLSALLVSTSKQMPICVKEQDARGMAFPVVVGGAAINRDFGRRIAFVENERLFEPGVFYAKDAFEGLDIVDRLTASAETREAFRLDMLAEARTARARQLAAAVPAAATAGRTARADLSYGEPPRPPFLGARTVDDVDLRTLWPCFDLKSLYRLSWGGANAKGEAWEQLVRDEFSPRLAAYQQRAETGGLLAARAVYGYFPAAAAGDDVIVYDPADPQREIARLPFTRQLGGEHLCLADYLLESRDGGASDVIALQVVTMGRDVSRAIDAAQAAGDYSESYFLHGFAVQAAEALAEAMHLRVRSELGLGDGRGKRYSWGYGACPDLAQHEIVWRLLDVERAIGAELTSAFQIVPEQSTAALIMHHPQASYFNAGAVRELAPA
jgi:5-methyltetrahydrofolate--homocysteine methyltransferase